MVGRQCIKDFLGHKNPQALASAAEWLCELEGLCASAECDDWLGGGCHEPSAWGIDWFICVVLAVIRENGWLSRGKARELSDEYQRPYNATADNVLTFLNPPLKQFRDKELTEWLATVNQRAREIFDDKTMAAQPESEAAKAIEWARDLGESATDDSDYLYNLSAVIRAGYANVKTAGIAASLIVAYRRAHDLEIETGAKKVRVESKHIGKEKQRLDMIVTCNRIFENDGLYGVTGIHSMTDDSGNRLTWFASGSAEWLEVGETYKVKATVKKHDEYKGQKQTVVNRVKIVELIEATESAD